MSETKIIPEILTGGINFTQYIYESAEEARQIYGALPEGTKYQMADVYQQAFGGAPWFERFKCGDCGDFSQSEACCPGCNSANLSEAYPVEELVRDYFPETISEFTPGILITAASGNGDMLGFTTGGFATLDTLVKVKYRSNQDILDSIKERGNSDPAEMTFYDNETCICPNLQQQGIGRKLSQKRVEAARDLGASLICGRTINLSWLTLKREQLTLAGYDFRAFVPEGDTYQVDGIARQFYLARKI